MNAAAIDLGTNSIKLLIVRRDKEGHMQVLFRHRSVVRLGEGSYTKKGGGKIPRFVQLRTLKVFQTYAQFLDAYKVDVVRATGTSATAFGSFAEIEKVLAAAGVGDTVMTMGAGDIYKVADALAAQK